MSQTLLKMAKDLVLAQIQAQKLSPEEMHTALQQIYSSLLALKTQEDSNGIIPGATPETPAAPVHWRKSLTFPYRDFSEYACGLADDTP